MKLLIGLTGKLGSGKDYIAHNLIIPIIEKLKYRYLQCAFADQIKINVMTKYNINYNDVYVNKTAQSRQLLQIEGTDIARSQDVNIWVNYINNWIKVHEMRGISVYIISDVRFKNEVEFIKEHNGIMIKVFAPQRNHNRLTQESNGDTTIYNKIKQHISECDLDEIPDNKYDVIINNDIDNNNKELEKDIQIIEKLIQSKLN